MFGIYAFAIFKIPVSNKRKIHNTVQVNKFTCLKFLKTAECFVNELDLYFLRFREQSVASINKLYTSEEKLEKTIHWQRKTLFLGR